MADPKSLENDAAEFLKEASKYENSKNYDVAVFYYTEAAQALLNAKAAGSTMPNLMDQAFQYTKRAEDLAKVKGNK